MKLTNYMWLLIWLFLGGFFLVKLPQKEEYVCRKKVNLWSKFSALALAAPYAIWAGFRGYVGDTWLYRNGFLDASKNILDIPVFFVNGTKDPGYEAFVIIMKNIVGNNPEIFFLIIATFQLLCIALIFRKYSVDYWISFFLFIASTDYASWMLNGMRQFIAVTAILACFDLILHKKYVPYVLVVFFVSTFHQSALLMIPVAYIVQGEAWNKKTILMLVVTLITVVCIDKFTPIMQEMLQDTQYEKAMSDTVLSSDDGTNIIRVLVYSVPALLSLLGLNHVRAANLPIINICVNCSIVTMAIYLVSMVTSGIYIGRLPIYTTLQGYIAVPWLIENIFTEKSVRIVRLFMIILFCIFFYYQMFIAWNF